jgi:hypothetical protein
MNPTINSRTTFSSESSGLFAHIYRVDIRINTCGMHLYVMFCSTVPIFNIGHAHWATDILPGRESMIIWHSEWLFRKQVNGAHQTDVFNSKFQILTIVLVILAPEFEVSLANASITLLELLFDIWDLPSSIPVWELSSPAWTFRSWVPVPLKGWTSVCVYFAFVFFCVHIGYWWENQKERDHCEGQDICGWKILI